MTLDYNEFSSAVLEWSHGRLRSFPWRDTNDPYEVLVAELLLQRTPAERAKPIYETIIDSYLTIGAIADADVESLSDTLEPLGFQNQRAQALVKIGNTL